MTETYATRVAKGSVYLLTQRIVYTVIGAVAFAVIARILTQTEMGVVVALTLTISVAQLLSDLGFSSGLTKHIAEYRGRNTDYSPLLFLGISIKTLIASFIAIVCAIVGQQLSQLLLKSSEYAILFQLLSIYLPFVCVNITMNSVLLGLNKIREMAIISVITAFIRQISAVALLLYGYGLIGLTMGWILGDLIYLILSVSITVKGKHIRKHSIKEVTPHLSLLAKFSWPLFLVNMVVFFYGWFDRAVLLAYLPLSEVAVYNVAFRAFDVLYVIPGALSSALFPYYSEQYGRDNLKSIATGVCAATRYISLLYTPLALGLMVTANATITLFAGPAYARGDAILAVLSLFGGITGISAALSVLLLVYNITPYILLINLASVGASLAMVPLLLPSLGILGIAFAKGVTMIVSFVLTILILRKRVRIEFDKEAIRSGWFAGVIMFLIVALIEQAFFSRYLLPLYILVGGLVYAMMLRIMRVVNSSDIQLLRNLVGKHGTWIVDFLVKILM